MNLSIIKEKIKDSLHQGADKFISARVRDELGISKPSLELLQSLSEDSSIDSNLHNFFKPVSANIHTSKSYKNIQKWGIAIVVILSLVLVFLFFTMIIPHSSYSNSLGDSQVIVNGKTVKEADKESSKAFSAASKIHEPDVNDGVVSKDVKVQNLKVSEPEIENAGKIKEDTKTFIKTSTSPTESVHIVKAGDTLEAIAIKYYGTYTRQNIDKIKRANRIRNSRLINVGQKLTIPI